MKTIFIIALITLSVTALVSLMLYDNGLVSMVWGDWVIETSLSFLFASIVSTFLLGYLAIRLLIHLWKLPKYWRERRTLKRYAKAQNKMEEGLLALEYGDWKKAEKALIHGAKQTEAGLVNYLSAAKMAHNQKAFDRREVYIREARELYPEATEVIGLVEARLIRDEWPQKARAILEVLYRESPKNSVVITELLAVVAHLKDWSNMATLLPIAKKYRAIKEAEWSEYQVQLLCGQMQAAEDFESLQDLWKSQSRAIKFEANILAEYIEQSLSFDQSKGLSELIEKAIAKEWNERLVYQYGRLPAEDIYAHLKQAEKWLAKQGASAVLFLTMGRIACRAQLWSRAHEYFRESLALQPELETFHALAKCYEREGEEQQAALIYKEAISQLPIGTIAQS